MRKTKKAAAATAPQPSPPAPATADPDDPKSLAVKPTGRAGPVPGRPKPEAVGTVLLEEIALDGAQIRTLKGSAAIDAVRELAASMRRHGQQVPVRVTRRLDLAAEPRYRLVFGHRRLTAARVLGWNSLRAEIFPPLPEPVVQEMRAIENLQREDLDPVEEALAVAALVESAGGEHGKDLWCVGRPALQAVADRLGKSLPWVEARTSVARLSPRVRALVASRRLPLAHAREVAKLADAHSQEEAAAAAFGEYRFSAIPDGTDGGLRLRSLAVVRGFVAKRLATLRGVPWQLGVPFAGRPACEGCLDNSACSSLFDADRPDARCLNLACYRAKQMATGKAVAAAVTKAKPDAACTPTVAGVRNVTPEFVKPATVARRLGEARGLGPKPKAGGAERPKEIPWEKRPENLLRRAATTWRDAALALVAAKLCEKPLRVACLAVSGWTRSWRRHGPGWGEPTKAQRAKIEPVLRAVARGDREDLEGLLADVTAAEVREGRNEAEWPSWQIRAFAGLLGLNLPRQPVLEDFVPKAAPAPRPEPLTAPEATKGKPEKAKKAKGKA